jgi:hypothetical protein
MDGSIKLSAEQRKVLLEAYRCGKDARVARRAHIVLLAAEGWSYREVRAITFASYDLIRECVRAFGQGGSTAVLGEDQAPRTVMPRWLLTIQRLPSDSGQEPRGSSCSDGASQRRHPRTTRLASDMR